MTDVPVLLALSLAALFGSIGAVQVAGPRFLRDAYRSWDYSQGLRVVMGLLDMAAAVMLAEPSLRGWGIALAAILTFGSVVTLLDHRHYACAVGVILMMGALVPATLAIPRANQVTFIVAAPHLLADTR
jgi:DoxX-like family